MFSEGIKWNMNIIFVLIFLTFRDCKKHTLKQTEKIGGTFLKIVTSSLQILTCIYFDELKIFCIFADSKFLEGLWNLNIFVYHKYSNMAKSNGITISFQNKKNYSKNGTADFEVTWHDTIKQFLLLLWCFMIIIK